MPSTHPVFVTGRDPISPLAIHLGLSQNRVPMGAPPVGLSCLRAPPNDFFNLRSHFCTKPFSASCFISHYIYIFVSPTNPLSLVVKNTHIWLAYIYIYHTYVHPYMHACIQTLHDITLHCIALHYITLHCIALHYITLHYIALHYIHIYIYIWWWCFNSNLCSLNSICS